MGDSAAPAPSGDSLDVTIHDWFELSYASFLTVPRLVMESMPPEWQRRMVALLQELDATFDWRPKSGRYWVRLRDEHGRFSDAPLGDYRRGSVEHLRRAPVLPARATLSEADLARREELRTRWGHVGDDFIRNQISHKCDESLVGGAIRVSTAVQGDDPSSPGGWTCTGCGALLSREDRRLLDGIAPCA